MSRPLSRVLVMPLVVVACVLAAPASALAQQSPFQGLPPATPPDQQTTSTTPSRSNVTTDSGLDTWQAVLIVLGGLVLLGGIGLAIARDARQRAPVESGGADAEKHMRDAHKHSRQAKVRQRQKEKAARASRRKNR